jgi:hypothetical protein
MANPKARAIAHVRFQVAPVQTNIVSNALQHVMRGGSQLIASFSFDLERHRHPHGRHFSSPAVTG